MGEYYSFANREFRLTIAIIIAITNATNGDSDMTILSEIANVLKTTEKNVYNRIVGMKLAPVCTRCGGSGQYSFNGSHSRCYGCNGAGVTRPGAKELPSVLENAIAAANDGRLTAYIEYLNARAVAKTGQKSVMTAWSATDVAKANSNIGHMMRNEQLENLADLRAANRKMYEAHERVAQASYKLDPRKPTYQADVIAFAAMVETAIKEINEAATYIIPQNLKDAASEGERKAKEYSLKMWGR